MSKGGFPQHELSVMSIVMSTDSDNKFELKHNYINWTGQIHYIDIPCTR